MKQKLLKPGFTLIELLVVMAIIGIISVLGVGSFISSQQKSRDSRRKSDLKQISLALEAYYNDAGEYPASSPSFTILGCNGGAECSWGDEFVDANGTSYMISLPADPVSNYAYHYESNGTSYQLYARLENNQDPQVPKDVNDDPQVYSNVLCGTVDCNYGTASSNTTPTAGRSLVTE